MLTFPILLPFAAAALLVALPLSAGASRAIAIATAALALLALVLVWAGFTPGGGFQAVQEAPWIPALGVAWRVGVDGISLPLALMSGLLFVAAIGWRLIPQREDALSAVQDLGALSRSELGARGSCGQEVRRGFDKIMR